MKKQRKGRRRSLSAGTVTMLLVTAFVIVGCAVFLLVIAGNEMHSRAHELTQIIAQTGAKLLPETDSYEEKTPRQATYPEETQSAAPALQTPQPKIREVSSFTLAAAGTVYAPKAVWSGALT